MAVAQNDADRSWGKLAKKKTKLQKEVEVIQSTLKITGKLYPKLPTAEIIGLSKRFESLLDRLDQYEPVSYEPTDLVFVENERLLDNVDEEKLGDLEFCPKIQPSESARLPQ